MSKIRLQERETYMNKLVSDKNLGNNLRRLRKLHRFTQDQLVAKLNILGIQVTRSLYSRYETGELNIPVRVIIALHIIYNCSYDAFFEGLTLTEENWYK